MATEKRLIDANALGRDAFHIKQWEKGIRCVVDWDDIEAAHTVDAVEVNKLGKLGRLMMPYKGCPRGHIGARGTVGLSGCVDADLHITELNPIEDVDGNLWVPVLADDLRRLKARQVDAVEVVRCKYCKFWDGDFNWCDRKCVRMQEDDFCSYGERRSDG